LFVTLKLSCIIWLYKNDVVSYYFQTGTERNILQTGISKKGIFFRFVRVRFIEEEHQAHNALCCIPVAPRRVSFLPFRERKVYRRGKSGTQRIMLYPGSSKKGIFFSFRESKVNRKEDVPGCKDEYNKLHLKGKSRKAQYVT
jgi:hypothetical protein